MGKIEDYEKNQKIGRGVIVGGIIAAAAGLINTISKANAAAREKDSIRDEISELENEKNRLYDRKNILESKWFLSGSQREEINDTSAKIGDIDSRINNLKSKL